jgi:hypothetical protein
MPYLFRAIAADYDETLTHSNRLEIARLQSEECLVYKGDAARVLASGVSKGGLWLAAAAPA